MKQVKRIFITGIAGFIGMHLAIALKKRGDFVIGCDHFNSYYDLSLKQDRATLLAKEQIPVIHCDINDQAQIQQLLKTHEITHFAHLAAQAGVRYSLENPESYIHSNLSGFVRILEALRHFPSIRLTYASSSSVYGLNQKVPFSETDPVDLPASFYGGTKRCNELIARAYYHTHNIRSTALRFFTVYGPWGRPDMAYYHFAKLILKKEPLPVFGEGKLMRDFTYIDDIIKGVIAAIDFEADFEIFNLGNQQPKSVLELIQILENCLNTKAILNWCDGPAGDVPITYADISKSHAKLGFQPKISLEEGLKQFTHWFLDYERKKIAK